MTERYSFKNCQAFMGIPSNVSDMTFTPINNTGFVDEAVIELSYKPVDLYDMFPKSIFCNTIGTLELKQWEWNFDEFIQIYGCQDGLPDNYLTKLTQIRLINEQYIVDVWRCRGEGDLEFYFNPTDFNKFDYKYNIFKHPKREFMFNVEIRGKGKCIG